MSKIGKWFKSIINWFKNLFKKKEKPSSGTTIPTPPTPPKPNEHKEGIERIISTLTAWEDTKMFREYVKENNINPEKDYVETEYAYNDNPEEALRALASALYYTLDKWGEEKYNSLRIAKIQEWSMK